MKTNYDGKNVFDLAGGIDLTILQRNWNENCIARNAEVGLRILSTGLELHSGAGEFGWVWPEHWRRLEFRLEYERYLAEHTG